MARKRNGLSQLSGLPNPLTTQNPSPIVAQRAPTSSDQAYPGQTWVDQSAGSVYTFVDSSTGWVTSPASGAGTFTSVTVSPGDLTVDTGDASIAGTLDVTGAVSGAASTFSSQTVSGNATVGGTFGVTGATTLHGDLTVSGTTTLNGEFDFSSANAINLITTDNAAGAITLETNGGTSETIVIDNKQGTGAGAITLNAEAGGFTIESVIASGISVTGASEDLTLSSVGGSVNITADEAAVDAIVIHATDAAGGIEITSDGTGGIALSAGGIVTMVPQTKSTASPTASVAVTANVISATWTGFTTASAGAQVFTLTNASMLATSVYFATATNVGANDAQMTVTRVFPKAGSVDITLTNNGAAALNGDVILNVWWIV